MSNFSIDEFKLPPQAKASSKTPPPAMVDAAFNALSPWFAGIISKIQTEWQKGVTEQDDRTATEVRLGKLAGEASAVKDLVLDYATQELRAKPPVTMNDYNLPPNATASGPEKAPRMIAKAFEALQPWFECIIKKIRPYYVKCGSTNVSAIDLQIRLGGLAGQVNVMRSYLERFVRQEIDRKNNNKSFSAGDADDFQLEPKQVTGLLEQVLDVKVGENEVPEIPDVDSVEVDIGGGDDNDLPAVES